MRVIVTENNSASAPHYHNYNNNEGRMPPAYLDIKDEIKRIVRDAIQDRLIKSERLKNFDKKVKRLEEANDQRGLEDYLQRLWDEL